MNYKWCPYPTEHPDEETVEMKLIADIYNQGGFFSLTFECPVCKAIMVVTCYPPEKEDEEE